jgi:hypothetical protein
MIPEIGQVALILALMTALVLGIAPLVGAQTNRPALMNLARPSAIALFLWVTLSYVCLVISFVNNDFSVLNVAQNSNSALPVMYRIAAIWGAHEGSLLLWALILAGWTFAVTLRDRMLPWRQIPVRLVRQPGPDLSLADVRVRLLSILQGDSEIADVLEVPVDQAIAWVRKALTLVALARQVPVHPDRREMGGASGNLPAMNFRDMSPRRFRAGLWS